jgi:glutamate-ammonia-ligase adenylyltransferase
LRRLRSRTLFTLAHRDLNGLASLDEVFETMTALAEESVSAAAAHAYQEAVERFGSPLRPEPEEGGTPGLIVAALGKLGGCELNVSSDIDLVFLYGDEGETTGQRPVTHNEFFAHAGRTVIALLSEITADGLAFRVDMRLRPFGDGPLATSLGGLEDYFVAHARPWERYAWLKSRVIAGPADEVRALVEPFVYRRYLDYGLLGALRDLHARIFETAVQRRKADDIKLGWAAFARSSSRSSCSRWCAAARPRAAAHVHARGPCGARRTRAHRAGTRARPWRGLQLPSPSRASAAVLRRPADAGAAAQRRASRRDRRGDGLRRLGCASWGAGAPPRAVQEAFNALFEGSAAPVHSAGARVAAWLNDPQAAPDAEGLAEDLEEAGIASARTAADRLIEFTRTRRYRAMSGGLRSKVEKLLPALVSATVETGGDARTLARLLEILAAIDRREAYFSLLLEYPQVLSRAARLASKSAWAARAARAPPDPPRRAHQDRGELQGDGLEGGARGSPRRMPRARIRSRARPRRPAPFQACHVLRLTIADVEGELPVMALSDELSALADAVLDVTLVLASSPAVAGATRHPGDRQRDPSSPAIASATPSSRRSPARSMVGDPIRPPGSPSSATASSAARSWATAPTSTSSSSTIRSAPAGKSRRASPRG